MKPMIIFLSMSSVFLLPCQGGYFQVDAGAQLIYPAHGRPFAAKKLRQNMGRIPNKALVPFF